MISLIVHGGAWDIPDDVVKAHCNGVRKALSIGWKVLTSGGTAEEAVERTIMYLEDDPTFDAGRGSFVNAIGEIELDASIMNGTSYRAGAVAAVQNIRHPISLVRLIMNNSEHIFLAGDGAARFAKEHGINQCRSEELLVGRELERWKELQKKKGFLTKDAFHKKGPGDTVGAVALDSYGTIVAGTSTGGTPKKYPGRVGDSPLIGCGTYADSRIGGVSSTGWGESIIRVVLAKTVIDIMENNGNLPHEAALKGIDILHSKVDGLGGVIVLNKDGVPAVAFNTPRMARAYRTSEMNECLVGIEPV
ncbi:MAG: isoaspartyl peptidase/L-asparaginase [Bacteroidales bacterium]|nr:isoaspartyl peptidase/L-asparaginase [Bacteroidales bacterium]